MNKLANKPDCVKLKDEIVECVANISEGRNSQVIDLISDSIHSVKGIQLLHVDQGYDANRTVFTFAGNLSSLFLGVTKMYETALSHINMQNHTGTHPRIGVVDVCPFIPIQGIEKDELIHWVHHLAKHITDTFNVPIYLYEQSALQASRKNLATIRKGEYEGLADKLLSSQWKPDFGPTENWEKSGATVIGARSFLLAYNVNLKSTDLHIAKQIAKQIRGSGYISKNGQRVKGLFQSVKAIGWYVKEYDCVQVSMNLTDIEKCSFYQVFEACRNLAAHFKIELGGSELIGLTPIQAVLEAGKFYSSAKDALASEYIEIAVKHLGLSSVQSFNPKERIIEHLLGLDPEKK